VPCVSPWKGLLAPESTSAGTSRSVASTGKTTNASLERSHRRGWLKWNEELREQRRQLVEEGFPVDMDLKGALKGLLTGTATSGGGQATSQRASLNLSTGAAESPDPRKISTGHIEAALKASRRVRGAAVNGEHPDGRKSPGPRSPGEGILMRYFKPFRPVHTTHRSPYPDRRVTRRCRIHENDLLPFSRYPASSILISSSIGVTCPPWAS